MFFPLPQTSEEWGHASMSLEIIDLYRHFSVSAPAGAAGKLSCWHCPTPPRVSPHRQKPAVLILPGGGYEHISPRESGPVALRFVARGWTAFVLEYSCAPLAFPTQLREAAMAMRLIREEAARFEVGPHMVAAVGFSAGGHLCGTLGIMWDDPLLSDIGPASLFRPDALGLCYPVAVSSKPTHEGSFENVSHGDPALRARLSLDKLVRRDMPPVFLWHTRDDQSVPCRNSLVLAAALEEAGVDFSLHIYRHGQHGLSTADEMVYPAGSVPTFSWDVPGWPEAMMAFFRDVGLAVKDGQPPANTEG